MNKSRRDFITLYVSAIIFSRQIQSQEVAVHFDSKATIRSSTKRIQRFLSDYNLNYDDFGLIILHFLPITTNSRFRLCMDRTNWNFGSVSINFLVITVYTQGFGIPPDSYRDWFDLLDNKGGNSNTMERINALDQCLEWLGRNRVDCFIADRVPIAIGIIGEEWIKYILANHLKFYIRVRQNQWVNVEGKSIQIKNLLKDKSKKYEFDNVGIFGTFLSMGLKYLPLKQEILAVVTNTFGKLALDEYTNRWSEEVAFQALKGRGFNLEDTHLQDFKRLKKLFAVCSLALAICYHLGIWRDLYEKPIPMKNHGYKENSFFRYGLEYIRSYIKFDFRDNKPFKYLQKLIEHNFKYLYHRSKIVP